MSEARRTVAAALLVGALAGALYAIHPAFFVKDDFQLEFLPASKEIAEAWRNGELPLLSRSSWVCAALAAEYQFGVFSLFRMLLEQAAWLLPLSLVGRGALLFVVHVVVAAAGAFLLARRYGATVPSSMLAALAASLNGWMLWWGTTWYAIAAGFAWLPWYWLFLRSMDERRGRRSWIGAAVSLYLLVAAGAPYVVAMAALVGATHVLRALMARRWRAALAMSGASLLGLALAAPAVLMLLQYWPYTARQTAATMVEWTWFVPPFAFFGAVVPAFTVKWPVFVGERPHAAVELLGAFVPLAALLAAWRREFVRRHLAELLLLALLVVLMLFPSAGPFRWSFRWLPLVHLTLAVAGAVALDQARARVPRVAIVSVLVTIVGAFAFDFDLRTTLSHAAALAVLCAGWLWLDRRGSRLVPAMPVAITAFLILLTFVAYSHRGETPVYEYDEALLAPAPFDPTRRYLAMYPFDAIVAFDEHGRVTRGLHAEWRPGNIPMLAGLEFINGYSPLGPAALRNVFLVDAHGPMMPERVPLLLDETGPNQLLHHVGIDGLVVPAAIPRPYVARLQASGWRPAARLGDCMILHRDPPTPEPLFAAAVAFKARDEEQAYSAIFARRTPALPVVLLGGDGRVERYGRRALSDVAEERNAMSATVRGRGAKALIVFRRPWLPGWRATLNGQPLPVLRANMIMPAVEIPPDAEGTVRLVYRPNGLRAGAVLAGVALLVLLLVRGRHRADPR